VISLTRLRGVHLAPPAAAVRRAILMVAAALPIVVAAALVSGTTGAVWSVLGLLAGVTARTVLDMARSAVVALAIAALVAAATAASGPALAAGLIVATAAATAGLADRWSAGVASLAPVTAAVAGSWPPGLTWPVAGGWLLAGELYGITTVALLHLHLHRRPIDARRAAVRAAALAALCGIAAGLAAAMRLPYGYWIVLALVFTLRPVVQESARKAVKRVTGTLLGVLIPIPLIYFLPSAALVPIVALTGLAFVSYLLAGEYIRQSAFMTATIVIVASGGIRANAIAVGEIRLAWTLLGTAVAAATAAVLWHVERDWPP
jgi:Fusaric acid resistance protein-like